MSTIPPSGYGKLTNLIRMTRVYMTEHQEGEGTEESPIRHVRTFFDEDARMLCRVDPFDRRRP